jgi:outer membrane protein
MKFLNKFFFIFIFFFLNIAQANSIESIAYIDMDFIIKNSEIGKKTLDSINNLNIKNINELKKKEKILKDLENEIISKKNIISKENFDKEVLLFKEKAKKFKEDQSKMVEDFNNFKKRELDGILSKISPIINTYMEKKSVKILLDSKNILIGRSNLNLTNEVIKEINEKIK